MKICYICNNVTKHFHQNLTKIKSTHSKTVISDFVRRFLGNFLSHRTIDNESNCICGQCLKQIDAFDLTSIKAAKQEEELRNLLLSTELSNNNVKIECKHEVDSHSKTVFVKDGSELTERIPIQIKVEPDIEKAIEDEAKTRASAETAGLPVKAPPVEVSSMLRQQSSAIMRIPIAAATSLLQKKTHNITRGRSKAFGYSARWTIDESSTNKSNQ